MKDSYAKGFRARKMNFNFCSLKNVNNRATGKKINRGEQAMCICGKHDNRSVSMERRY
jgi:hypothetical protein